MSSSVNAIMWCAQDVLHKKPQVVPATLLLLSSSMVVYRHMTYETYDQWGDDTLKTFLAMILLQMLPLLALELKIMSCADPVGLFCKFASPVTLTHLIFMGMRVCLYFVNGPNQMFLIRASVGLLGAFIVMHMGFRQRWSYIFQYRSVWNLVGCCLLASLCTQGLDYYLTLAHSADIITWKEILTATMSTSVDYIEICAFVPAVWIVYREDQSRFQVESTDTKRTSTAFFLFLVVFYFLEDVVSAYQAWEISGLGSAAHIAHFFLLVDFACYVLAHIYNPEKLVGELRKWLPADFSHEV